MTSLTDLTKKFIKVETTAALEEDLNKYSLRDIAEALKEHYEIEEIILAITDDGSDHDAIARIREMVEGINTEYIGGGGDFE